jgi:hypothetical protein
VGRTIWPGFGHAPPAKMFDYAAFRAGVGTLQVIISRLNCVGVSTTNCAALAIVRRGMRSACGEYGMGRTLCCVPAGRTTEDGKVVQQLCKLQVDGFDCMRPSPNSLSRRISAEGGGSPTNHQPTAPFHTCLARIMQTPKSTVLFIQGAQTYTQRRKDLEVVNFERLGQRLASCFVSA